MPGGTEPSCGGMTPAWMVLRRLDGRMSLMARRGSQGGQTNIGMSRVVRISTPHHSLGHCAVTGIFNYSRSRKPAELICTGSKHSPSASRLPKICARLVSMQSCLRSFTHRRSHLGLAFKNSGLLVSSRRFARMPAVQSRAVQTEAAPSQKTGLKSLEVCHTFLNSRYTNIPLFYHGSSNA